MHQGRQHSSLVTEGQLQLALLVARRVADGEAEPVSAEMAAWTIQQIDMNPESPYNPQAPAYIVMLGMYRDAGLDLCQAPNTNGTPALQMQRKDVPEELWGGSNGCP